MFAFAFLLGVWCGWVLETFGVGPNPVAAEVDKGKLSSRVLHTVSLLAFVGVLVLLGAFQLMNSIERWDSLPVRVLYWLIDPSRVFFFAGFALGWAAYRYRYILPVLLQNSVASSEQPPSPDRKSATTFQTLGAIAGHTSFLTVATIIGLAIFYPKAFSALDNIKFGDFEAKFARSTAQSTSVNLRAYAAPGEAKITIEQWASVGNLIPTVIDPVWNTALTLEKSSGGKSLTGARSPDDEIRRSATADFLRGIVEPLARVMGCYGAEFKTHATSFHPHAAELANEWGRIALRSVSAGREDNETIRAYLDEILTRTDVLIQQIDEELIRLHSTCGDYLTDDQWTSSEDNPSAGLWPKTRFELPAECHRACIGGSARDHLVSLFSNGYVVGFIGDFIRYTQNEAAATSFFSAMEGYIDPRATALTGRINFHYLKADALFAREDWDYEQTIKAQKKTQGLVELVIGLLRAGQQNKNLMAYYEGLQSYMLNTQAVSLARVWSENGRLTPTELNLIKELASDMKKWAETQSPNALLADPSTFGNLARAKWLANIYDTLAMQDIIIGHANSDFSAERCSAIGANLSRARNTFGNLQDLLGDAVFPALRAVAAHLAIFKNACEKS
jgi:hypothetical protein